MCAACHKRWRNEGVMCYYSRAPLAWWTSWTMGAAVIKRNWNSGSGDPSRKTTQCTAISFIINLCFVQNISLSHCHWNRFLKKDDIITRGRHSQYLCFTPLKMTIDKLKVIWFSQEAHSCFVLTWLCYRQLWEWWGRGRPRRCKWWGVHTRHWPDHLRLEEKRVKRRNGPILILT